MVLYNWAWHSFRERNLTLLISTRQKCMFMTTKNVHILISNNETLEFLYYGVESLERTIFIPCSKLNPNHRMQVNLFLEIIYSVLSNSYYKTGNRTHFKRSKTSKQKIQSEMSGRMQISTPPVTRGDAEAIKSIKQLRLLLIIIITVLLSLLVTEQSDRATISYVDGNPRYKIVIARVSVKYDDLFHNIFTSQRRVEMQTMSEMTPYLTITN